MSVVYFFSGTVHLLVIVNSSVSSFAWNECSLLSGTVRLFVIVNCSVSSFVWNVCSLLSGSVLKTRHFR